MFVILKSRTKKSGSQGYIDFVDRVRITPSFGRQRLADGIAQSSSGARGKLVPMLNLRLHADSGCEARKLGSPHLGAK